VKLTLVVRESHPPEVESPWPGKGSTVAGHRELIERIEQHGPRSHVDDVGSLWSIVTECGVGDPR